MKMQKHFIEVLKSSAKPVNGGVHKCANCFRPKLMPDQVAFESKGDAYCWVCVKEASK